jgi:hypothetical protein
MRSRNSEGEAASFPAAESTAGNGAAGQVAHVRRGGARAGGGFRAVASARSAKPSHCGAAALGFIGHGCAFLLRGTYNSTRAREVSLLGHYWPVWAFTWDLRTLGGRTLRVGRKGQMRERGKQRLQGAVKKYMIPKLGGALSTSRAAPAEFGSYPCRLLLLSELAVIAWVEVEKDFCDLGLCPPGYRCRTHLSGRATYLLRGTGVSRKGAERVPYVLGLTCPCGCGCSRPGCRGQGRGNVNVGP